MTSILNKSIDLKQSEAKENIEIKVENVNAEPTRIIFISDCDLNENIRNQFRGEFEKIIEFNIEVFVNRELSFFEEKNLNHLFINLKKTGARNWLSENIKKAEKWKTLIVTNSSSKQEWIDSLKEFSNEIIKFGDIRKIQSLTLDELLNKLQKIHIKKPKGLCGKIFDCVTGGKKQKNSL